MQVLIVGCGYIGSQVAQRLEAAGHEVTAIRRHPGPSAASLPYNLLAADITHPASLSILQPHYDWMINTVSSSRGGPEAYEKVFYEGSSHVIQHFADSPPQRYVHLSSTSVYGQTDGSTIDESSPATPSTVTGKWLKQAEDLALNTPGWPGIVLRVAGIYGPERGVLFDQFLTGEARIHGDGHRMINMIHRDDVVGAILQTLDRGEPGSIYNVADDQPVSEREFFQWLANSLHRPLPAIASVEELAKRKRGFSNKRISNRRLKEELGYRFKFPTYRDGFASRIEGEDGSPLRRQ